MAGDGAESPGRGGMTASARDAVVAAVSVRGGTAPSPHGGPAAARAPAGIGASGSPPGPVRSAWRYDGRISRSLPRPCRPEPPGTPRFSVRPQPGTGAARPAAHSGGKSAPAHHGCVAAGPETRSPPGDARGTARWRVRASPGGDGRSERADRRRRNAEPRRQAAASGDSVGRRRAPKRGTATPRDGPPGLSAWRRRRARRRRCPARRPRRWSRPAPRRPTRSR